MSRNTFSPILKKKAEEIVVNALKFMDNTDPHLLMHRTQYTENSKINVCSLTKKYVKFEIVKPDGRRDISSIKSSWLHDFENEKRRFLNYYGPHDNDANDIIENHEYSELLNMFGLQQRALERRDYDGRKGI